MQICGFDQARLKELYRPPADSHKGQNGKLLVIGGSKLFHSSIFWSADVASRMVDLVHFASPANENNEVVRHRIKNGFWQGIVVDWGEVENYIEEDDCVLIGPGMPREEGLMEGEPPTSEIVNRLLTQYPEKKWVVDGGALQEVDPKHLRANIIITPHQKEFARLLSKLPSAEIRVSEFEMLVENINRGEGDLEKLAAYVRDVSERFEGVTILLKGVRDMVYRANPDWGDDKDDCVVIEGGNEGLTKGGTGDVLAGITAGFYTKNEAVISAAAASKVLKTAADELYQQVGSYYNTSDLVKKVPEVLWELLG